MSSDSTEDVKAPRRSRLFRGRRNSIKRERMFGHLEDRFVSIAIRVSLYPIVLVIVNGVIAIGDLYMSLHGGVHTKAVYGLYCVYYLFYGIRGVTFAALAALVDPCLGKGLKAAWAEKFPSRRQADDAKQVSSWSLPEPVGCVAPLASAIDPAMNNGNALDLSALSIPGAPPLASRGSRASFDSDSSMDVLQALFASEPPCDTHTHTSIFGRPTTQGDEEKRHGFHPHMPSFHPHLPHFHPHMPHLHLPHFKHLPWFMRRHLEKEAAVAEAELAAQAIAMPTPPAPASPAATPASFTNAFTGIPAEAMPSWMNDDAADDVVCPQALAAAQATSAADAVALERALVRVETGQGKPPRPSVSESERKTSLPCPPPPAVTPGKPLARLGHGVGAVMGTSVGLGMSGGTRRGSLASSHFSGSSAPGSARASFSFSPGTGPASSASAASPALRSSLRSPRPRWASGVGRRSSAAEPRTPLPLHGLTHDPRARREATLALAERLYEEMEAQL